MKRERKITAAIAAALVVAGIALPYARKKDIPFLKRPYFREHREWSIAIYSGDSPLRLSPHPAAMTPVITGKDVTDVPGAVFVADPFMIKDGENWDMFFEILTPRKKKGVIGLATSDDGVHWKYRKVVLEEKFHLSYPYVFQWEGEYYMIPETFMAKSIRLYRAVSFPEKWEFVKTLLDGKEFVDSSVAYFNKTWWLFTEANPRKNDTLELYYADSPLGEWRRHPKSPIIRGNPNISRPGGRLLVLDGKLIRITQDCHPEYGNMLRAFEITRLTKEEYAEKPLGNRPVLQRSGHGWNAAGMHQMDAIRLEDGRWLACVDGHRKYRTIRWGEPLE